MGVKMKYYIGIDGGGTKTQYALFDENKNLISSVFTGGSNHENLEAHSPRLPTSSTRESQTFLKRTVLSTGY